MALHFARFAGLSAVVILLVTMLLLATKGLNLAEEFVGGMIIEVHYPVRGITSKSVRERLVQAGFADAVVKEIRAEISGYPSDFRIIFPPRDEVLSSPSHAGVVQQVIAALRTDESRVEATAAEVVPPEVGREVLLLGSIASTSFLILVCVAIMAYPVIRHGCRVGLSIAVTNIRNMVIILGIFLLTYIVFQWEFSLASMTAMSFLAILATGAGTVYALRAARS